MHPVAVTAVLAVLEAVLDADVAAVLEPVLRIVLIVVAAVIARRLAGVLIRRAVARVEAAGPPDDAASERLALRAATLAGVLGSVATVAIATLAALMLLGELGVSLGPLIAGVGIVGLALGFGAQRLVQDVLSGLFVLLEDQFGVGDVVDTGEVIGTVESVSLRLTRVRDVGGTLWHLPNGDIRRAGNFSHQWARAILDVDIAYDADIQRASRIIEDAANELADERADAVTGAAEVWGVQALAADGVGLRVAMPTAPAQQWAVERELRARVKAALEAGGVEIPFPQRTVWLRPEEPRDGEHGTQWRPTSLQPAGAGRRT